MRTLARTPLWAVAAVMLVGGCLPPPEPEPVPHEELPVVDLARLQELGLTAFDVTDVNNGFLTKAEALTKYDSLDAQAELIELESIGTTYMLVMDESAGEQRIFLPGTSTDVNFVLYFDDELVFDVELLIAVHRGFRQSAIAIRDDLQDRLRDDLPVRIVGYSQGGGVGVLLGRYLQLQGRQILEILTFGQPKVTDWGGTRVLRDLPLFRVVSWDDPVPKMPVSSVYQPFGPALILLDGPYAVYLTENSPVFWDIFGSHPEQSVLTFFEHVLYDVRMEQKLDLQLIQPEYVVRDGEIVLVEPTADLINDFSNR